MVEFDLGVAGHFASVGARSAGRKWSIGEAKRKMRILVLAPQPFYQERGTPIAVNVLLRALSERGDEVDLLTFHEGSEVSHPGLVVHRIEPWPRWRGIRPGFSWKKVYCDIFFLKDLLRLLHTRRYDVVHATEEAVFLAHWFAKPRGARFVYDMDSSMSAQILDRYALPRLFGRLLESVESRTMRAAEVVVPVCEALAEVARRHRAREVFVLKDVSLVDLTRDQLRNLDHPADGVESLRAAPGWTDRCLAMYIGNLEPYQGIDFMLAAFKLARARVPEAGLIIVGGVPVDVERYREKARALGLDESAVRFLGQRPVAHITGYMSQADLLLSPRIHGQNTPMKLYTYLDSGVAVLATDLPTHTQVADPAIASLAAAQPEAFGAEMAALLRDPERRATLAAAARELMRREHSYAAFRDRVHELYDRLDRSAAAPITAAASVIESSTP